MLRLRAKAEWSRLFWVGLNGATGLLLCLKGGARLYTPVAVMFPAATYLVMVAWPGLIDEYPASTKVWSWHPPHSPLS